MRDPAPDPPPCTRRCFVTPLHRRLRLKPGPARPEFARPFIEAVARAGHHRRHRADAHDLQGGHAPHGRATLVRHTGCGRVDVPAGAAGPFDQARPKPSKPIPGDHVARAARNLAAKVKFDQRIHHMMARDALLERLKAASFPSRVMPQLAAGVDGRSR